MLDNYMKNRVGYLIADAIWTQTTGKKGQGEVIYGKQTEFGEYEWEKFFEKFEFDKNPERVKDVADYFLSFYQKMGQKILSDPSFILDNKDPKKNWEQLLSPEALEAKAIEETVRQMVEKDPSLKEPLQEYMEKQIKEQIAEGNSELEIGYLFAKEPLAPEVRALKKDSFEVEGDALDELEDHIPAALFDLTEDYALQNFSTDWKLLPERAAVAKNFYVGEPGQVEYRLKKAVEEEVKKRHKEARKKVREEQLLEDDWPDFEPDPVREQEETQLDTEHYIPVSEQDLQNYFNDSLGKLKADEYQKDPTRYVERLMRMQLLENQNLIFEPASIEAFEKEKKRLFELAPDKKLMDALIEKKAELCQKRYESEMEEVGDQEAIDFQIYALEELTKGSEEYKRMEAEKDLSAYPHFEAGLGQYQRVGQERIWDDRWSDRARAIQSITEFPKGQKEKVREDAYKKMGELRNKFMEALGGLDRSEKDGQKKYIEAGNLPLQIVMGERDRIQKWKNEEQRKRDEQRKREKEERNRWEEEQRKKVEQEKKRREEEQRKKEEEERKQREEEQRKKVEQEKKKREEEQRKKEEEERKQREEEQRKRDEQERKLQEEQKKKHAHLDRVANDLHASVRKGVFGGKKDNSKKYDDMVQALDSLLKNPIRKEPTPQQKEEIKKAYEVCWNYADSRKGAKTEEGKKRLNLAEEALGILAEMNPDLKERYEKAMQGRKKTSFRELEHEAGHERGRAGEVHREPQRERKAARERSRER